MLAHQPPSLRQLCTPEAVILRDGDRGDQKLGVSLGLLQVYVGGLAALVAEEDMAMPRDPQRGRHIA